MSQTLNIIISIVLLDPTLNTRPNFTWIKESRSNFNGYKPYINGLLKLKSWDFASMLGLVDMSGSWDLRPHVHQPSKLSLEVNGCLESYDHCVLLVIVRWNNLE